VSSTNNWVFINNTTGTTNDGNHLTNNDLAFIAQAVEIQMNRDYNSEVGGLPCLIRVGNSINDIQVGEKPFIFVDSFTDIPNASAYHDVEGNGVEVAHCAISTCFDSVGPHGASVDASHEILEDEGDPGCNRFLDDGNGTMHADERCDAIETQAYTISVTINGITKEVYVSNFLLNSWQVPGASPPYTFMTKNGIAGGIDPSGPFQTSPTDNQGNYQI